MIVRKDRVICTDPLDNEVYFDSKSLGLEILVPELSNDVTAKIRLAIERPFIIVKAEGKRLYCSAKKRTGMYFFIAEVILNNDSWYVKGHRGEDNFEKLQDLFLRGTKIYCGTTNLPYDASPIVKEDISQPDVLSYYRSSKMEHKSDNKEGSFSINAKESEEDYEDEADYEEDSLFQQASCYTMDAIGELLVELIQNFSIYRLNYKDLPIVATILKVVKEIENYNVPGYLYVLAKQYTSLGNFRFNEIHLDQDGLKLTSGGYVTEGNCGGDSYSTVIFPVEDEDAAVNIVQEIETFVIDFKEMLSDTETEIEVVDSGDGIEEKQL
jgi:hypothetical protein